MERRVLVFPSVECHFVRQARDHRWGLGSWGSRMAKAGGLMKHMVFNKSLLQYLACPLSKEPLRYCEKSQELVSDAIGVAYPIIDGVPCLVPMKGRIIDSSDGASSSAK